MNVQHQKSINNTLNDLFIIPHYDDSSAEISFTAPKGASKVNWLVLEGQTEKSAGSEMLTSGAKVSLIARFDNFKPWHVDSPFLYELKLVLTIDGHTKEVSQMFGMREILATGDGLFVNKKPFQARGFIRGREAHDHPNHSSPR